MKRTRRQTKQAAAAAGDDSDAGPSHTQETSPNHTQPSFFVPLPDDLDTDQLSEIFPQASFETPSPEDIAALYRLVLAQNTELDTTQRELEEAKAEVERHEVSLDQALHDKETGTKELEASLENVQNELKQLKQERDELASERNTLKEKLASLSTTQLTSSAEVESLKSRVEDVEREKRDLIGVVSRLKEDSTQRDEEIQTLRSDLRQARQEQQTLSAQLRESRSAETSTKFKIDSLSQQLQLAKDEAERSSRDLTEKSEEYSKYRRAKNAELAELQAAHDTLVQAQAASESTLKALQSAHASQAHQLTQALARIQDLNGQLAEQEATYSSEATSLRRLIDMMEEREAQAKAIVDGIEKEWAGVGERAERREAVLREEIEAQRERAEEAEKRLADMKKVMDRMDRGEFPVPDGSMPGTPARGISTPVRNMAPDFLTQGMMGLSPTVAMASRVQRGGKTFTEVYADYVKLQEEFAKKSMEYDHMDRTLTAVLAQIEERAPILAQQRQEYERLQSESSQLASQLAQALAERDANSAAAAESNQKLAKSTRENDFLNKQLEDLGRQIRVLLKELARLQDPSIPADEELEEDPSTQPADNIEAVITNNLVLYRSIPGLQEQNQKLLKIVRELGAKMEAEEKEYREELEAEQSEAVREAHQAIKVLQEQLEAHKRSSEITIQSFAKERDALKATLARERSAGSTRVNGINGYGSNSMELPEDVADIQNQFEVYKTEMSADSGRLREDLLNSQREAATLGTALAKANAKIDYLNERHRMLSEQTTMQRADLERLDKRNHELNEKYTRVSIECNRYSEDIVAAKSAAEQLRNECANLRAEKNIWESVQSRLVEENKILTLERSQLSDLMANVQRMHGDLERSGENDRRRLESQIQMLETQTQDLRTQLQQERDSVRSVSLQKDIELKELRNKLEKATQEYSRTREGLAVAETSKKHLEDQVEQLTRQIKGAEEKLAVYERRPSGVNGIGQHQDQDLSREQQLEAEVAELRAALKVAEVDLATARSHVQQFQEISQASEAALSSLNATYDEYKSTTEAQITSRETEFIALEDNFDELKKAHTELQGKVKEMQKTFDAERAAWNNDKKTLEGTIFDMSTSEKNIESDRESRQNEIRQQEERAKAAEERYSREIVAHAEAIKVAEELRQELDKARAAAIEGQAASSTAQAKLTASEMSWKQQKEALDKEVADLNTRCKDLAAQNNLLHQHLEHVTSQAAQIRSAADSSTPLTGEGDSNDDADTKLAELRSVVAYLRKEKEIVDLQLELSKQENLRLKTQIDHLSQNLEETRKTLSEERERAVEVATSETQHAELVERINQLSILRESNATLRADCETHAKLGGS
ncbi:hypothetical protein BXZ70DRAFT_631748 [Cristinia sonorae]|uniref:Nucleoprotein TPR/MLP1 domain-containing protein n=1 Tax=Cristinia sonorae TaxID=1940300 RepID=A0A8K0UFQ6_9AGAR|nr:hypothetical protein BXZ70DRAFT_631748 [Cristinia sonorae]